MKYKVGAALTGAVMISVVLAPAAWAHPFHGTLPAGFAAGFAHPFGGADHIMAGIAVGLLSMSATGRRAAWRISAFLAAVAGGWVLGLAGGGAEVSNLLLAGTVVGLGVFMILDRGGLSTPVWSLVALFGLLHGQAHGAELAGAGAGLTAGLGVLVATGILVGAGRAAGEWLAARPVMRHRAPVVLGSVTALMGLLLPMLGG